MSDDLAREVVAAGLLRFDDRWETLTVQSAPGGWSRVLDGDGVTWVQGLDGWVPDLAHPATAGVIVGMLAATGRLNCIYPPRGASTWDVGLYGGDWDSFADTSLGRAAARAWPVVGKP